MTSKSAKNLVGLLAPKQTMRPVSERCHISHTHFQAAALQNRWETRGKDLTQQTIGGREHTIIHHKEGWTENSHKFYLGINFHVSAYYDSAAWEDLFYLIWLVQTSKIAIQMWKSQVVFLKLPTACQVLIWNPVAHWGSRTSRGPLGSSVTSQAMWKIIQPHSSVMIY